MISTAKHSFTFFPHPTSPCFFPFLPLNTNPLGFICPIFGSRAIAKRKQKVYWVSWNFAQKANVIGEGNVGRSNRWKLLLLEKSLLTERTETCYRDVLGIILCTREFSGFCSCFFFKTQQGAMNGGERNGECFSILHRPNWISPLHSAIHYRNRIVIDFTKMKLKLEADDEEGVAFPSGDWPLIIPLFYSFF